MYNMTVFNELMPIYRDTMVLQLSICGKQHLFCARVAVVAMCILRCTTE